MMLRPDFYRELNEIIDASRTLPQAIGRIAEFFKNRIEAKTVIREELPAELLELKGRGGLVVSAKLLLHMEATFRDALLLRLRHRFKMTKDVVERVVQKDREFFKAMSPINTELSGAHARLVKELLHPQGVGYLAAHIASFHQGVPLPLIEKEGKRRQLPKSWIRMDFSNVARTYLNAPDPDTGRKQAMEKPSFLAQLSRMNVKNLLTSPLLWSVPWTLLNTSDSPWVQGTKPFSTRIWLSQGETRIAQSLTFRRSEARPPLKIGGRGVQPANALWRAGVHPAPTGPDTPPHSLSFKARAEVRTAEIFTAGILGLGANPALLRRVLQRINDKPKEESISPSPLLLSHVEREEKVRGPKAGTVPVKSRLFAEAPGVTGLVEQFKAQFLQVPQSA